MTSKKPHRINRLGEKKTDTNFSWTYAFVFSDDPDDWLHQKNDKRYSLANYAKKKLKKK